MSVHNGGFAPLPLLTHQIPAATAIVADTTSIDTVTIVLRGSSRISS